MTPVLYYARYHNDPSPVLNTGEDVRTSIERDYLSGDEVLIDFHFRCLSPRLSRAISNSWNHCFPQENEVLEQLKSGINKEDFTITLNPFFTAYYLTNSPLIVTDIDGTTTTYTPESGHPYFIAYPYSPDMPKDKQDALKQLLTKAGSKLSSECVLLNTHPRTIRHKNSVEDLETTLSAF